MHRVVLALVSFRFVSSIFSCLFRFVSLFLVSCCLVSLRVFYLLAFAPFRFVSFHACALFRDVVSFLFRFGSFRSVSFCFLVISCLLRFVSSPFFCFFVSSLRSGSCGSIFLSPRFISFLPWLRGGDGDGRDKEVKRATLLELVEHVDTPQGQEVNRLAGSL